MQFCANHPNGERGGLVAKVAAAWPRAGGKGLPLLAAGASRRTFVVGQCNRGGRNNPRPQGGNPWSSQPCGTSAHTAGGQLAVGHGDLAGGVVGPICDWLASGAIAGGQRHPIVGGPARSMLWGRPHMGQFCGVSGYHRQGVWATAATKCPPCTAACARAPRAPPPWPTLGASSLASALAGNTIQPTPAGPPAPAVGVGLGLWAPQRRRADTWPPGGPTWAWQWLHDRGGCPPIN